MKARLADLVSLASPGVVPFIGARGAWVRESVTTLGFDVSAKGFGVAGLGGIPFRVGRHVGIETAVSFTFLDFGDAEANGVTVTSGAEGTVLAVHAGLVVGLP